MTKNFVLASGNAHKAQEFGELFPKEILNIEAAPNKLDVIEDGKTFRDNALLKAEAYYKKLGVPVLADDSGLVVAALPDELGIHSARFGGDGLTDKDRAFLLLDRMKEEENRAAYFVCVLCFYLNEKEVYFFEGRVEGSIGPLYQGDKGFGYDPVFIPADGEGSLTMAQLPDWKNIHSHRAVACRYAKDFFASK
ncbi:non-canonical purine NTP pyrophosphatase [Bacteriovoracaceae bacterium]|nr:non-canonical purine NTP pyrophosphatase [Bacteriovoracaceae bacterium]|tara:strand:+ start:55231 stop:55812 length:582 start_codon:yes stop_codon:yes gene_type:complete